MQTRQQVFGHILVPKRFNLFFTVTLPRPLGSHRLVNNVNHFHNKSPSASGRVQNLHKVLVGRSALRNLKIHIPLGYLAPCGCVGKAIHKSKFCLQQFMHTTNDVRNHWMWRIENPTTFFNLCVISLQKAFEEVHDRIFMLIAITKVSQDGVHICSFKQILHFTYT